MQEGKQRQHVTIDSMIQTQRTVDGLGKFHLYMMGRILFEDIYNDSVLRLRDLVVLMKWFD